jgi:hypothetical protein
MTKALAWHSAAAVVAERGGDHWASAFHLGWLLEGHPADATLHRRRAAALEALGRQGEAALHRGMAAVLEAFSSNTQ